MPIHFLWGDEDYLIEKEALKIKKDALKDDINPLNYRAVDNPSFALFSELLRTNAMFFGDSVVQIKCPNYFLESKKKVSLDDKQTAELVNAINNISEKVHIILICPTPKGEKKKPDARKKLYKELAKITTPKAFETFKNYESYKYIPVVKKLAQEIDIQIGDNEICTIVESLGTSLREISIQLEKLKLFAYPEKKITGEMIEKVVSTNTDLFSLIDFILAKNWAKSLKLISEILQKEHFLPSLAFVQTSITNLLKIKLYSTKLSSYDLAVKFNMNEFIVKKNLEKLQKVQLEELIRLKINLSDIDYKLKTGVLTDPICAYEIAFLERKN